MNQREGAGAPAAGAQMPTVLIVDDDRKITDMLRRTLAYEGYDVVTASTPAVVCVTARRLWRARVRSRG